MFAGIILKGIFGLRMPDKTASFSKIISRIFAFKEGNMLENSRLFENGLHSVRPNLLEEAAATTATIYKEASQFKLPLPSEKSNFWLKRNVQGTSRDSQDITDINYSQFRNRLIDREDHNSTFQRKTNCIVPGNNDRLIIESCNRKS